MGFFDKLFGGNKARKEELEKLQEDYRRLRALNAQHALARRRPGSEESNQVSIYLSMGKSSPCTHICSACFSE